VTTGSRLIRTPAAHRCAAGRQKERDRIIDGSTRKRSDSILGVARDGQLTLQAAMDRKRDAGSRMMTRLPDGRATP